MGAGKSLIYCQPNEEKTILFWMRGRMFTKILLGAFAYVLFATSAYSQGEALCLDLRLNSTASDLVNCIHRLQEQVSEIKNSSNSAENTNREELIPVGAVLPFDKDDGCPEGWSEFASAAGRVIIGVGAGNFDSKNNLLTNRRFRDKGGQESVVLSRSQMPKHSHRFGVNRGSDYQGVRLEDRHGAYGGVQTEDAGGNQPHNNMPPYIALYYCKKN